MLIEEIDDALDNLFLVGEGAFDDAFDVTFDVDFDFDLEEFLIVRVWHNTIMWQEMPHCHCSMDKINTHLLRDKTKRKYQYTNQ